MNCDTFKTDLFVNSTRKVNYDWKGAGWYRFAGDAGSRIPTTAPGINKCGTASPGWMNSSYPENDYETKEVQFCFQSSINECDKSTTGKITDCGTFFVYHLKPIKSSCNLAYCGTNTYEYL